MPEDLRWNAATLWAGPKCHIVHYPLSGWKVFNLVVTYHNDAPEPVAGQPVSDDEVMQGFGHVHERAQNIIRHGKNWRLWVLCDRDPTERWIDGRVVLLGDAAHPMLQYFAQGACQAMEDAVCLSHMLAQHDDLRRGARGLSRATLSPHGAGADDVARDWRAHLPSRRRSRAAAQRRHEREVAGGMVRRLCVAVWRDGVEELTQSRATLAVVPDKGATSDRDPGPITTECSLFKQLEPPRVPTTLSCGYGSRRSPGRQRGVWQRRRLHP